MSVLDELINLMEELDVLQRHGEDISDWNSRAAYWVECNGDRLIDVLEDVG